MDLVQAKRFRDWWALLSRSSRPEDILTVQSYEGKDLAFSKSHRKSKCISR